MSEPGRGLRIVLYRPHAEIWFRNPVRSILKRQFLPHKYGPFFDELLASSAEIHLSGALLRRPGWKGLLRLLLEPFEILVWCRLNGVPLSRIRLLLRIASLRDKDALFLMHYGNLTHESSERASTGRGLATRLASIPIVKVAHMTHYAYQTRIGAANLAAMRPDVLVAENDLRRNSPFFRRYFGGLDAEFWTLPYIAAPRFVKRTSFDRRIRKLVATGSITYKMRAPEFTDFFGTEELQPLRRELHGNASRYTDEMDCFISDLNASRDPASTATPNGSGHPQRAYYRRDIVETYNAYAMFVVPEEICDLPAIGFVEGMACGCAYLGIDSPMYRDLGLVPGVHFIAYDGSADGLMARVRHYQRDEHFDELSEIAERGRAFVEERLRAKPVYQAFLRQLGAKVSGRTRETGSS